MRIADVGVLQRQASVVHAGITERVRTWTRRLNLLELGALPRRIDPKLSRRKLGFGTVVTGFRRAVLVVSRLRTEPRSFSVRRTRLTCVATSIPGGWERCFRGESGLSSRGNFRLSARARGVWAFPALLS